MTDDGKQLDDYVAAMHGLVQDGRALQGGRKAFAEATQALDELVADHRKLGDTLATQSGQLGGVLTALEGQDIDAIEKAIREQAASGQQRDAQLRSEFQSASASLTREFGKVTGELKQSTQRLDDFRTILRQHIDASERHHQELSSTMQNLRTAVAESERLGAMRDASVERRLRVVLNLMVVLMVGVVALIVLQFVG